MPDGRVTLQDVADEAGLSKAATSYALRGLKGSAHTLERVRTVADRLGYTANPIAQALAGGRSGSIGVCGSLCDLWQQELTVSMAGRLRAAGFSSAIADADADPAQERDLVQQMADSHVDGVIALTTDPSAEWWRDLPAGFVVVSVGDVLTHRPQASSVVFDNVHGVRTALEHLAGLGHRRIGLLTSTLPSTPGRPAETLATAFAREHGLSLSVVSVPPSARGATSPTYDLLGRAEAPTALFCLSDSIAFGAYRAAAELGLSVPDDVSILGYDDHDLADLVSPPLTTFGWDEDAITHTAIDLLIEALEGHETASSEFRPALISRGSTGSVQGRGGVGEGDGKTDRD